MGVKDVEVTDLISQLDGTYSIYGENFTKWSKVYVNDEKQDSKFLNNTRIELTDTKLENGDELEISQVGSSNTIFRTSQTYVYQDGKLMKKEDWEAWKAEQEAQEADGAQPETDQAAEQSVSEQQP